MDLEKMIHEVWNNRELLKDEIYTDAVRNVIDKLDTANCVQPCPLEKNVIIRNLNLWQVNEWVKQAILLYFGIQQMETYTLASI